MGNNADLRQTGNSNQAVIAQGVEGTAGYTGGDEPAANDANIRQSVNGNEASVAQGSNINRYLLILMQRVQQPGVMMRTFNSREPIIKPYFFKG